MALGFLYFIGWMLLFVIIGLSIYFIWMANREKDDPENQSILINFMPQYSDGHSLGSIDSIETSGEMTKIVFYPRDLNYIRMKKKDKNVIIKPLVLFVLNKNIIHLPVGGLSCYRNIILAFPPRIEEIPEKLRDSKIGQSIMSMVGKSEEEIGADRYYRKIINAQTKIQDLGLPDKMVQDYMEKQNEMGNNDPTRNLGDRKEKE